MTCEVLVKQEQEGFIATLLGLPGCVAQATTRAEAIEKVRLQAQDWLTEGEAAKGEIVKVELEISQARERGVGVFADVDDETWNRFQASIKEYRDEVDANPDRL